MDDAIKRWIRPVVYPPLHAWQWFYDRSRDKVREYRVRRDHRLILGDGTTVLQDIHGIRFIFYPFDQDKVLSLIKHSHDAAEFEAIPRLVRPGDIAFDVGANVGFYSVLLSRLCSSAGHVWAFEPVPETYWRLRETLALNRCENVVPIDAAVSDKPGSARMNLFEPRFADLNTLGSPSVGIATWNGVSPVRSAIVQACTLTEFCETEGIERINFLKVDVEGFELAVFRGAERLLREQRVDYICFEIFQPALKDAGLMSRDVFAALEAHGYRAYRFDVRVGAFQGPILDTPEPLNNFFASWRDLSRLGV
jgi:FkbM family methyltransferase